MTTLALQFAVEEDKVAPGLLGFTVVALIAAATWFLLKSMTKQLKRVDFEEKDTRPTTPRVPTQDTPTTDTTPDTPTADAPTDNAAK